MVAGWVDPTSDPTIWLIDMQMCMGQVAVLFAVSQEQVAEHGVGTYACMHEYCTLISAYHAAADRTITILIL